MFTRNHKVMSAVVPGPKIKFADLKVVFHVPDVLCGFLFSVQGYTMISLLLSLLIPEVINDQ